MLALPGAVAVVTGSSRGFGLAVARELGRRGATVIVSSRRPEATAAAAAALRREGLDAHGCPCDVGELAQVEALGAFARERGARLGVWVNNAGQGAPYGAVSEIDPGRFVDATRTNVLGCYHGSLVALGQLLRQGGGALVNVVGRGEKGPVPFQAAYGASKAWIRNFTLAVAAEHRRRGVDVVAFMPGLMPTEMVLRPETTPAHAREMSVLATVLRLWGAPPELAAQRLVQRLERGRGRPYAAAHGPLWLLLGPLRALVGRSLVTGVTVEPRPIGGGHGGDRGEAGHGP